MGPPDPTNSCLRVTTGFFDFFTTLDLVYKKMF